MYLTAHHVKHKDVFYGKWTHGVNSFQYSHKQDADLGRTLKFTDVEKIAESTPGLLTKQHLELSPSGNIVLSYLDLSAPESTLIDPIQETLNALRESIQQDEFYALWKEHEIGARFWMTNPAEHYRLIEFDKLQNGMISLFKSPDKPKGKKPLIVMVEDDGEKIRYSLGPNSVEAIRAFRPDVTPAGNCSVQHSTVSDFVKSIGDIHTHVLESLTHLTLDQIIDLGGAIFENASTGERIKKWPAS